VGVAAKALDDGLVAHFKAPGVFHARLIKQDHRFCVHQSGLAVHVGHVGKAALRQGQRGLRKGAARLANNSHRAAAASVTLKRVRMTSSMAGSLAKWCFGVSLVNQKSRIFSGFMLLKN